MNIQEPFQFFCFPFLIFLYVFCLLNKLLIYCFYCWFFRKHAYGRKISNLGYAFVNFTTPAAAFKFYKQFQGFAWNVRQNPKICEINAAKHQVSLLFNFVLVS